jgi:hypothetical protein
MVGLRPRDSIPESKFVIDDAKIIFYNMLSGAIAQHNITKKKKGKEKRGTSLLGQPVRLVRDYKFYDKYQKPDGEHEPIVNDDSLLGVTPHAIDICINNAID